MSWVWAVVLGFSVLAVGGGFYAWLGQPLLAARSFEAQREDDFPGLIATLARRMRERPEDAQGWALLGRGYLTLGQNAEGAKALARAVALAEAQKTLSSALVSDYGEAVLRAEGADSKTAETAFQRALALDPKEQKARYYLGLSLALRGHAQEAMDLWQGLLAEAPQDAPWRQALIDQIAALNATAVAAGQTGAPDIQAMVAGLAARLKDNPKDLPGWERLLRAYVVLKDEAKLKDALAEARAAFADDADTQQALINAASPAVQ